MIHAMLIGNPNCGKTTLFNALTGDNQRIGNWPGVTVEKKTGQFDINAEQVLVTDLPGIYSLVSSTTGSSQDEQITAQNVATTDMDIIINVIDACHLERHLYLTSQLLELGKPVVIALNMIDIAHQRGITIDPKALSKQLGCPVIELQAHRQLGVEALKHAILAKQKSACPLELSLPSAVSTVLADFEKILLSQGNKPAMASYLARRFLEGDTLLLERDFFAADSIKDADVLLADARYQIVHQIVSQVQRKKSDASEHLTDKIDRIVLHRVWALPIFFAVMYLMFLFAINVGGAFQDFFDITTDVLFVQGTAWLLQQFHMPAWVIALLANGVGKGINTTLTFIPVIAAMFFFLSLLELSGYMARAAFVVDKIMRILGLPGKSFVPMIVGFGCNVPAIMAARTLDSERDRLLTILMSPFMSCSARLAIYAVFVAAFFPTGGQNIVFSLYLIGILMAVLTGFFLRKTILHGQTSPLILELPAYHKPSLRRVLKDTSLRLRHFVVRAGKMIIPVCVILGGLNALTMHGGINSAEASSESVLSWLGQYLTPLFYPMGLHQENWPATVGLLTGMLAKEVVVGSLNTLYGQMITIAHTAGNDFDFWGSIQAALWSVPHNLTQLGQALLNPIVASAPDGELSQSVYGMMYQQFDGKAGAYAYLLFILLYIPCVSTMAVIRQEANRKWMWFSITWSFLIAYASAVLFYQVATYMEHPQQTMITLGCIIGLIVSVVFMMRLGATYQGANHVTANS
ncbi:Fe(2+) transporter permease subunit FeoB [Legionella oakridgensis]|uniref:Fe(2+) transporter permease subunit FeoB n=1 Tax=Legionella oakridgensis TaxID=29423 RepID=UPI0003DE360E|nr:Fe(2+) transporter permease subunit FeoB [Legionella oakridgensis]ETO94162.1 ferrous iron transporter FeoB [Legionella oakridgensis RV-2-2007]